ncbi:ABC-F family ATP-binding cassette domain-containing protein [Weissella soli]|uniref:ATP-binding cassette subfamily F protein uup n=3 Tax=Weissella soli TaxID=155866 RepID=A0A288QWP6_9LACO|nr:ABC-F family ATP-binding cassette domain-containing protein [Weissella soli]AOT56241.1 Energy-dependent translational throttle protein EttA [Weissella soli]NKY82700.1 ABC-F family ATP-binding cassette domain-containing protein [Weissella soli]RDL11815.1 ATP-binding cassette subfamily F protein uup [Weissella soli]GEN92957.1 ABC transporter ATP-binding protein [Weissella soli]
MKQFRATELRSVYGEKTLLDGISFLIETGDRVGLIGVNGSGKTTLLNAIAGVNPADSGKLDMPNDYHIAYLQQEPSLDPEKTVMEAIFAGAQPIFQLIRDYEDALDALAAHPNDDKILQRYTKLEAQMNQEDAWLAESEVKSILMQLHLPDLSLKIATLSGGQRKRVGLAQVLIEAPDLLLLDEPTNHLDFDSIEWLEKYLADYKGAVLTVTHDRYFLDSVANRIFELSFGQLYEYTGNYQQFVVAKAERVAASKIADHKAAQLYKQELAWMRTSARARSTKQKARENRFSELDEKHGNLQLEEDIQVNLGQQRLGKKVIEIEHAQLAFDERVILKDFSALIQANQRIGITGPNGTGKSTLLNAIAGKVTLDSGLITIGETVKMAYYTQTNEPIPDDKRMIAYLSEVAESVVDREGNRVSVSELLEQFLFPSQMHGTLIRKLSGGEQRRLYLLKLLLQQPNVLLLDEPTNDLDIGTLTVLEDYLKHFAGTVITVSHDRYFLDKVADRLFIFQGDGVIERYDGQFSEYLANFGAPTTTQDKGATQAAAVADEPVSVAQPKKKKLTYSEQREWATIETDIATIETQIEHIQGEMEANGADFGKLSELQAQLDELNVALDEKMTRWETLSEIVEGA